MCLNTRDFKIVHKDSEQNGRETIPGDVLGQRMKKNIHCEVFVIRKVNPM